MCSPVCKLLQRIGVPSYLGQSMMQDRDLGEYSASLSSSSKQESCNHQLCQLRTNCKSPNDPCSYTFEYYMENTSSSGFLIEDKLHLKSISNHATQIYVQASVIFGCGRKQSGGYLEGAAPDGVMGLGPGNISVPSQLAKAGLVRNSFSICFDRDGSGRILFGDQGLATQQTTQFLPLFGDFAAYMVGVECYCVGRSCNEQTRFQALVDSGSSFTFLPTAVFNKVVSEFDKQVNATRITIQEYPWKYCYNGSSEDPLNFPSMKLMLATNQSFLIHNAIYEGPVNQGYKLFCLTLLHTDEDYGIIGQNFMMGYNMVFDGENLKLGWSNSKCEDVGGGERELVRPPISSESPNPLPTNQQQSSPNTRIIAPAVAERASSKSSLRLIRQLPSWHYPMIAGFSYLMRSLWSMAL